MVSGKVAENIRVCREPWSSLIKILGTNPYLGRHVGIVDDPPDVGHEAHVQHPVGLVQHEVLHRVEPDLLLLHKVQQSAHGVFKQAWFNIIERTRKYASVHCNLITYFVGVLAGAYFWVHCNALFLYLLGITNLFHISSNYLKFWNFYLPGLII